MDLLEVIVMCAFTALDSLTGQTSSVTRELPVAEADGGGRARLPAPCMPADFAVTKALAHRPESVGEARHAARAVLEAWRMGGEPTDAVVLVVSELVTNAVEHAQAPLSLHLHREYSGGRVWVGVTDGGPASHDGAWTSSCAEDEHGRGLGIIEMLADAHGTRTHACGNTHWARLTAT
ncbi:ATP-binding protein [Streptomyces sp. NPDC085614]|uniref:ATP-binding protein n=1 Tax=Streptomyces sp. NPDC085614 TaxID=3365733 RepID=UPI0037D5F9EB